MVFNIKLFPFALSDSNKEGFLEFPEIFAYNQGVAFVGSGNNNNNSLVRPYGLYGT